MIALLVTKIERVLSYVLWILNWWQLISKLHPVQLSTKTVDFVSAALIVQLVKFFKKSIYVFCSNSI